jgi:hypothetical protein
LFPVRLRRCASHISSLLSQFKLEVYYESIKREPKIRGIKKCRCDERLQTKTKEFKPLPLKKKEKLSSAQEAEETCRRAVQIHCSREGEGLAMDPKLQAILAKRRVAADKHAGKFILILTICYRVSQRARK